MTIEQAYECDIPRILEIYEEARAFMRKTGNLCQWQGGYPSLAVVREDMARGQLFTVKEGEAILGVFVYFFDREPTYDRIEGGEWLEPTCPYGVLHRVAIAADAHGRGIGGEIFRYALKDCRNVRIDTHKDNLPMQRSLERYGFSYRGIIYLANGDSRMAYQQLYSRS